MCGLWRFLPSSRFNDPKRLPMSPRRVARDILFVRTVSELLTDGMGLYYRCWDRNTRFKVGFASLIKGFQTTWGEEVLLGINQIFATAKWKFAANGDRSILISQCDPHGSTSAGSVAGSRSSSVAGMEANRYRSIRWDLLTYAFVHLLVEDDTRLL